MEMVATSKMKRAQDRVVAARPYARALADVIASLYNPALAEALPAPAAAGQGRLVRARHPRSRPIADSPAPSTRT